MKSITLCAVLVAAMSGKITAQLSVPANGYSWSAEVGALAEITANGAQIAGSPQSQTRSGSGATFGAFTTQTDSLYLNTNGGDEQAQSRATSNAVFTPNILVKAAFALTNLAQAKTAGHRAGSAGYTETFANMGQQLGPQFVQYRVKYRCQVLLRSPPTCVTSFAASGIANTLGNQLLVNWDPAINKWHLSGTARNSTNTGYVNINEDVAAPAQESRVYNFHVFSGAGSSWINSCELYGVDPATQYQITAIADAAGPTKLCNNLGASAELSLTLLELKQWP